MLRISRTGPARDPVTLRLEGRVIGPWVGELRQACEANLERGEALLLNLAEVEFVDANGVALLQGLMRRGVALVEGSPFIEEQLKRRAPER